MIFGFSDWISAISDFKQSDIATETISGVTSLTQSNSVKSQPLRNVLFLFCACWLAETAGSFSLTGVQKAEADELNISQAAIQFLMSAGQKDAYSP